MNDFLTRETLHEPISKSSNSEATAGLSWLPNHGSCLAVGTGFKWLRIYDIRGGRPLSIAAHSKAVQGVLFDPFSSTQLLTYSEDDVLKVR